MPHDELGLPACCRCETLTAVQRHHCRSVGRTADMPPCCATCDAATCWLTRILQCTASFLSVQVPIHGSGESRVQIRSSPARQSVISRLEKIVRQSTFRSIWITQCQIHCPTAPGTLCGQLMFRLSWCHAHLAVTATVLFQQLVLVCRTHFLSSCVIRTSPMDCSDDC